ncbi:MAG: TonB-dependent receptor, partial [Cytophagaceae bacterium]
GNFWSVGGAWRISQEAFFSNITFVNELKLRASYGVTGNNGIGRYAAQGLYSLGRNYEGQAGIVYTQLANPALQWEKAKTTDLSNTPSSSIPFKKYLGVNAFGVVAFGVGDLGVAALGVAGLGVADLGVADFGVADLGVAALGLGRSGVASCVVNANCGLSDSRCGLLGISGVLALGAD